MQELVNRAKELLADKTVARVLGWKAGDLPYNPEPAYFETEESLKDFVYNGFCGANLSKYMIEASKMEGKTLVCLKPCDTYSFNQLLKEHRIDREKAYIIGVGCKGKLDIEKIRQQGIKGIEQISGAEMEDDASMLTIQTLYGEKSLSLIHIWATIAYNLSNEEIASEIVLIDINEEKVEGEVLDIAQGTCFSDPISIVAGTYEDAKDSDVVIITSGIARKPVSYTHLDVYKRQEQCS